MTEQIINKIQNLELEEFEKISSLDFIVLNGVMINISFNPKEICNKVEEELRKKIRHNKQYSKEEQEWILSQYPTENEELMLLKTLKDITILKLKELKKQYITKKEQIKDEIKFKVAIKKMLQDIFGKNPNKYMADITFNTWKRKVI